MELYTPIFVLAVIAAGFAIFSMIVAAFAGPKRYNRAKLEAYECGIEPTPSPRPGGGRFPIKYYLTAMLFIVFDIEIVFLYPWAVTFDALGSSGSWRCCSSCSPSSSPTRTCGGAAAWNGTEGPSSHGTRREAAERIPADHRRAGRGLGAQGIRLPRDVRPRLLRHRDDGHRRVRTTTWRASAWRSSAPRPARPT